MKIIDVIPEHLEIIERDLRDSDIEGIRITSGKNPDEALKESVKFSDKAWTLVSDAGEVFAMFGAYNNKLSEDAGRPWLIGTNFMNQKKIEFLRGTPMIMKHYYAQLPYTWYGSVVKLDYPESVRWHSRGMGYRMIKRLKIPDTPMMGLFIHTPDGKNPASLGKYLAAMRKYLGKFDGEVLEVE